jgi:hypothetical protein
VLAVERDLRAVLQTLDFEKELSAPMLDTPPITDLHVFEGRKEELEQLQTAMELAGVRVGILGTCRCRQNDSRPMVYSRIRPRPI